VTTRWKFCWLKLYPSVIQYFNNPKDAAPADTIAIGNVTSVVANAETTHSLDLVTSERADEQTYSLVAVNGLTDDNSISVIAQCVAVIAAIPTLQPPIVRMIVEYSRGQS
jgi:hypothetical protein